MLGGISLLLMQRLPQDLVTTTSAATTLGLGEVQLRLAGASAIGIADDPRRSSSATTRWLRRYKYTWAAVGIGLLLLAFVLGSDVAGPRLTLRSARSAASRRSC